MPFLPPFLFRYLRLKEDTRRKSLALYLPHPLLTPITRWVQCAFSLPLRFSGNFLEIIISSPYTELWLVVSWCDYLRNALRLSSVLLQTPQSNNPKGHEEEDYDGQLRFPRRWVEPDFWDGQGHCTQVCRYLFWLPSCFHLNSWIRHSKLYIYIYLWLQCHKIQRM